MESFKIYCDESCHLEHDGINAMGIGAVWCPANKIHEINERIKEIKLRHGVNAASEIKWTKVSPQKRVLYEDIVNYFFDDDDLRFRCVIIPNKTQLDHRKYNQTHDEWYYKMYFTMLKIIFSPQNRYCVYTDIKDTHSGVRIKKLHDVCCNNYHDFSRKIIEKIQPIRSNEVQVMQIVDILLGATVYCNRDFPQEFIQSETKLDLIKLMKRRSGYSLKQSTLPKEEKFNILIWEASYDEM